MRDKPDGFDLVHALNREIVYGRRPVREVIRAGRRQILELSATERALASEPWLRDGRVFASTSSAKES